MYFHAESPKRKRTASPHNVSSPWRRVPASNYLHDSESPERRKPRDLQTNNSCHKLAKSTPFKKEAGLIPMNSVNTTKTSNIGSSFTESCCSSDGIKSDVIYEDRISDFYYNFDVSPQAPACFEYNHSNPREEKSTDDDPSKSIMSCGLAGHVDKDADAAAMGHDNSFISSISPNSSPPSFCREDDGSSNNILMEDDEFPLTQQGIYKKRSERKTSVRLFQTSPASPILSQKYPSEYSEKCFCNSKLHCYDQAKTKKSEYGVKSDIDDVDESIRRLEESSSSNNAYYSSSDESDGAKCSGHRRTVKDLTEWNEWPNQPDEVGMGEDSRDMFKPTNLLSSTSDMTTPPPPTKKRDVKSSSCNDVLSGVGFDMRNHDDDQTINKDSKKHTYSYDDVDFFSMSRSTLPPMPKRNVQSENSPLGNTTDCNPNPPHTISHPTRRRMRSNVGSRSQKWKMHREGERILHLEDCKGEEDIFAQKLFDDGHSEADDKQFWQFPSSPVSSSQSVFCVKDENEDDSIVLSPSSNRSSVCSGKMNVSPAASDASQSCSGDKRNQRHLNHTLSSGTLPIPDQDAFDGTRNASSSVKSVPGCSGDSGPQELLHQTAKKPTCPPAPERKPLCIHIDENDFYDTHTQPHLSGQGGEFGVPRSSFVLHRNESLHMELSKPIAMRRQNSLCDNKILASSTVPRGPRSFGEEEAVAAAQAASSEALNVIFERDFDNKGIIGSGTFAEVFKATEKGGSHESYAIKKSRRQFRSRRDRENLLSEVHIMQIVGATACPHVIQFYRAWQEDGYFYVQIELAERGTLRDFMNSSSHARQSVQDRTVVYILHDVAAGLEHIHSCGIVHLDIKPQNILISQSGVIKIGDFGIAMAQGNDEDEGHEGDTRYLPRELLNSTERHFSADIFSLGLTLYEVCLVPDLDVLPYSGEPWQDLRQDRIPPLPLTRDEVMVKTIMSAMAANPSRRPSASDMLHSELMSAVDISAGCNDLLIAEMIPPTPKLSRSDSFCPIMGSQKASVDTSEEDIGIDNSCSTPSFSGAAYRNLVSPPQSTLSFFEENMHQQDPRSDRAFHLRPTHSPRTSGAQRSRSTLKGRRCNVPCTTSGSKSSCAASPTPRQD